MLSYPQNDDIIERWGERVGASNRTVARLFKEETGLSFGQWRQQLGLAEAVARLALDVPVATIATELGYQSSSAFISMFRKTPGNTPQRYLKRREGYGRVAPGMIVTGLGAGVLICLQATALMRLHGSHRMFVKRWRRLRRPVSRVDSPRRSALPAASHRWSRS